MGNRCRNFSQTQRVNDYYKVLEVDFDATEDKIRTNYLRLALKWHPDKHKGDDSATAKFQEINEAYNVLSDRVKRLEYDSMGSYDVHQYTLAEYLSRFKGMILTCNGLGIGNVPSWQEDQLSIFLLNHGASFNSMGGET
uniref:J domain-containing protein n=1 Tax=Araucaria cunninghamii TaxID=56994 RepID=A0A0D6QWE1_ARACU